MYFVRYVDVEIVSCFWPPAAPTRGAALLERRPSDGLCGGGGAGRLRLFCTGADGASATPH